MQLRYSVPLNLDPECLPPIEATDLLCYLVMDTSFYTKEQFKAFKSMEAYNQMVSGFITNVKGKLICNKFVVVGKMRHSQRMNEPLPVWIITSITSMSTLLHVSTLYGQVLVEHVSLLPRRFHHVFLVPRPF